MIIVKIASGLYNFTKGSCSSIDSKFNEVHSDITTPFVPVLKPLKHQGNVFNLSGKGSVSLKASIIKKFIFMLKGVA